MKTSTTSTARPQRLIGAKAKKQIDGKSRLVTVRQALGAVLLFCSAQQAAVQLINS